MKLIIGLGNPGKNYATTRHNVGFIILDKIIPDWQIDKPSNSLIHKTSTTLYAKPQTFMNNSGSAVRHLVDYYHIALPDILVIYDDKDLPFGTIRFRVKGSSGGHNGIKSIIEHLGTTEFARLKVGIAPVDNTHQIGDTADYVLARFSKDEKKSIPNIIDQVIEKIGEIIYPFGK
ncbi:MAG: aminoacyl-tRNA hydrolase [Patescibacteria group bacterium]